MARARVCVCVRMQIRVRCARTLCMSQTATGLGMPPCRKILHGPIGVTKVYADFQNNDSGPI